MDEKQQPLILSVDERGMDQVPDDVYLASVVSMEKVAMPFGETLRIKFRIEGGTQTEKEVSGLCKYNLNPQTKLFGWLKQLGANLKVGTTVDVASFVGKRCRILVKNKIRDSPTGEKLTFPNVAEVLPA